MNSEPESYVLQVNLPLEVPFEKKSKVQSLGARPHYQDGKFVYWMVFAGTDVLPFKEFWNTHFSDWYSLNVLNQNPKEKGVSLSKLMGNVKSAIIDAIPSNIWITAEIVDIRKNNHVYLELNETANGKEVAKARAMIFMRDIQILHRFKEKTGIELHSGLKIMFKANVSFSELYGLSIQITEMNETFTVGELEVKRKEIIDRITFEGLMSKAKNRALPERYKKVAVIAPKDAAGLGDFKTKSDLLEKHDLCRFDYYFATFQGANASKSIVDALRKVEKEFRNGTHYDAVAIIRGGGDKAGIYALNEYEIAKAVCLITPPVISGIGHDRDNTIIDEIANIKKPTPSMVISEIESVIIHQATEITSLLRRLIKAAESTKNKAESELNQLSSHMQRQAEKRLYEAKSEAEHFKNSLKSLGKETLEKAKIEHDSAGQKLIFIDPRKILGKGYAIAYSENKVIADPNALKQGSEVDIVLSKGRFKANITSIENKE